MGSAQEAVVASFLAAFECRRLGVLEVDRVVQHLAPDARYFVCAWEAPFVGRDAIREELIGQGRGFTDLRIEVDWIASAGSRVVTERRDCMVMDGKPVAFHLAGVFEVNDDGTIAVWRDYFDSKEIATQVGRGPVRSEPNP